MSRGFSGQTVVLPVVRFASIYFPPPPGFPPLQSSVSSHPLASAAFFSVSGVFSVLCPSRFPTPASDFASSSTPLPFLFPNFHPLIIPLYFLGLSSVLPSMFPLPSTSASVFALPISIVSLLLFSAVSLLLFLFFLIVVPGFNVRCDLPFRFTGHC